MYKIIKKKKKGKESVRDGNWLDVGLQREGKISLMDDWMNSRGFLLNQKTQETLEGKEQGMRGDAEFEGSVGYHSTDDK